MVRRHYGEYRRSDDRRSRRSRRWTKWTRCYQFRVVIVRVGRVMREIEKPVRPVAHGNRVVPMARIRQIVIVLANGTRQRVGWTRSVSTTRRYHHRNMAVRVARIVNIVFRNTGSVTRRNRMIRMAIP